MTDHLTEMWQKLLTFFLALTDVPFIAHRIVELYEIFFGHFISVGVICDSSRPAGI